jgi:glucosamine--fructose-6-phosphate aminotransferase (isomerizing)
MGFMQTEISQQPQTIKRLLRQEDANIVSVAAALRRRKPAFILIAARGTSDNAARYAQYLLGAHNHLQVALATPSLFTLYHSPPALTGALVIGISQSGQSPDIVEVVHEARAQNRPTIAITNEPDSPLAQVADHTIRLHTGPERAIAATKTYTSSLCALALLSSMLADDQQRVALLQELPGLMVQTIKNFDEKRVERYRYMAHCAVVGRGYNYATAFEIALKIKELTRVVAEPYSAADFRHGPIAVARDGFPALVVAAGGPLHADIGALVADLRQRGAELLLISHDQALLDQAHVALPLPPDMPEWLTPLVAVLPGQLFALRLAQAKGLDPDQPRGLMKVTETW